MCRPVDPTVTMAYTDEDDNVELEFNVTYRIEPGCAGSWDVPGAPTSVEDVEFELTAVTDLATGERTDAIDACTSGPYQRQMATRYDQFADVRANVNSLIFSNEQGRYEDCRR